LARINRMDDAGNFTHVIVGTGPNGLTVLKELIKCGVHVNEILVLNNSSHSKNEVHPPTDFFERAEDIRKDGLFSKGENGNLRGEFVSGSPAEIWGTSCLPYSIYWRDFTYIDGFRNAFSETVASWGVQAEYSTDSDSGEYQITGEELGKLERKEMATKLVEKNLGFIHSRLALKSQTNGGYCLSASNCFSGCPNGVPYSPERELNHLLTKHAINYRIFHVSRIDTQKKQISSINGDVIEYKYLYLATGCTETYKILKASLNDFQDYGLLSSSVLMLPIFSLRKQTDKDFFQSFLFNDLIFSTKQNGKQILLTQIYLPTHEISSRILATIPKRLLNFMRKIRFPFEKILKHVGIAMIFTPGTSTRDTKKKISVQIKRGIKTLKTALRRANFFLLPLPRAYLLNEESMHVGSLGVDGYSRGLYSTRFMELEEVGIYICDTSILPDLPPGPHTAIASAFVKLLIQKVTGRRE